MRRAVPFLNLVRRLLDRRGLRFVLIPLASHRARSKSKGLKRIIYDHGVWIHGTSSGYFAFHRGHHWVRYVANRRSCSTAFPVGIQAEKRGCCNGHRGRGGRRGVDVFEGGWRAWQSDLCPRPPSNIQLFGKAHQIQFTSQTSLPFNIYWRNPLAVRQE